MPQSGGTLRQGTATRSWCSARRLVRLQPPLGCAPLQPPGRQKLQRVAVLSLALPPSVPLRHLCRTLMPKGKKSALGMQGSPLCAYPGLCAAETAQKRSRGRCAGLRTSVRGAILHHARHCAAQQNCSDAQGIPAPAHLLQRCLSARCHRCVHCLLNRLEKWFCGQHHHPRFCAH